MKRIMLGTALAALTSLAIAYDQEAVAQQVVVSPQPYLYSSAPQTYYYPSTTVVTTPVYRNRGVLSAFSKRGGIGTTPFLGNTRGMGAYSTNYSAPVRVYTPSGYAGQNYGNRGRYYPTQNYVYPTRYYAVPTQTYYTPPMIGG